jgi:hypothetical protein
MSNEDKTKTSCFVCGNEHPDDCVGGTPVCSGRCREAYEFITKGAHRIQSPLPPDAQVFGRQVAMPEASRILGQAKHALDDRAASRDTPGGERSMALTVEIFNAATGLDLTEAQGWQFMIALKWARANNGKRHSPDDYVDMSGYVALWGECEGEKENL